MKDFKKNGKKWKKVVDFIEMTSYNKFCDNEGRVAIMRDQGFLFIVYHSISDYFSKVSKEWKRTEYWQIKLPGIGLSIAILILSGLI